MRRIKLLELTDAQYERIAPLLPKQRGNVRLSNLRVLNAILYLAEHGCQWRGLPEWFGNWHNLYADEPVVEEQRPGPRLRAPAA